MSYNTTMPREQVPSFGLGLMGTMATNYGDVRIFDNNAKYRNYSHNTILKKIGDYEPQVVGFNINLLNFYDTTKLIKIVKKCYPHIILIGGGIFTYSCADECLATGLDIVFQGDAENSFPRVLEKLKVSSILSAKTVDREILDAFKNIPGLMFKKKNNKVVNTGAPELLKNLDILPFVNYDLFNLKDFIRSKVDKNGVVNHIATQRGCPFKCSFCHQNSDLDYGLSCFRDASPKYKADYVEYLHQRYDVENIVFHDSNFTLNQNSAINFCQHLKNKNLQDQINLSIETTIGIPFSPSLLKAMKEIRWRGVGVGVERLTSTVSLITQKNSKKDVVLKNLENLKVINAKTSANFLMGLPDESIEILNQEKKEFSSILPMTSSVISLILLPLPGTKIHQTTNKKRWYSDPSVMDWQPSYYHIVYNYFSNAIHLNYFDLPAPVLKKMIELKEYFYEQSIKKVGSNIVWYLFLCEKALAKISLAIYRWSPSLERVIFSPIIFLRNRLWNYFVMKYYGKG